MLTANPKIVSRLIDGDGLGRYGELQMTVCTPDMHLKLHSYARYRS